MTFDYLGCSIGYEGDNNDEIRSKQTSAALWSHKAILLGKSQKQTLLEFYIVAANPVLSYGSK
jgi:hypothetical protein